MPKAKRRSSGKVRKFTRPCTYDMGYVRQDLYACHKCTKAANGQLSGFCRGCREACHADHLDSVFELYTKRDFRCDCGNTRAKNTCLLMPHKDDLNVRNESSYSHNFVGRYCRCDRVYDYQMEMAQCAMCEDWFHEDCYQTDAADRNYHMSPAALSDGYELTCMACVATLPLLADYYDAYNAYNEDPPPADPFALSDPHGAAAAATTAATAADVCTRPRNANISVKPGSIDYLWRPGFRARLCQCDRCVAAYRAARAAYLVDRDDFVAAPPEEDPGLLNATDDAEIANDLLAEEEAERRREARQKAITDRERIPRKPLRRPPPDVLPVDPDGRLHPDEVLAIRKRIGDFLAASIRTNGGSLNPDTLRAYLTDLKADLMKSFSEKLSS